MKATEVAEKFEKKLNELAPDNSLFVLQDEAYSFDEKEQYCEIELGFMVELDDLKTDYLVSLPQSLVSELELSDDEAQLEYDLKCQMICSFSFDYELKAEEDNESINKETDLTITEFSDDSDCDYENITIDEIRVFGMYEAGIASDLDQDIDTTEPLAKLSRHIQSIMNNERENPFL